MINNNSSNSKIAKNLINQLTDEKLPKNIIRYYFLTQ